MGIELTSTLYVSNSLWVFAGNSYVKDVGVVRNNAMHPWSPMEILLNGKA